MKRRLRLNTSVFIKSTLILLGVIIVFNTVFFFFFRSFIQDFDEFQIERKEVSGINDWILKMDIWSNMAIRGYLLDLNEENLLKPYNDSKKDYLRAFTLLQKNIKSVDVAKERIADEKIKFSEFFSEMDRVLKLHQLGREEEANVLYNDYINNNQVRYFDFVNSIEKKYDDLYEEFAVSQNRLFKGSLIAQGVIIFFVVPMIILVFLQFQSFTRRRKKMIQQIGEVNRQKIFNDGKVISTSETETLKALLENIEAIEQYVDSLSKGDYEVKFKKSNKETTNELNEATVKGKLDKMRNKLLKAKIESDERVWKNEGLSILNEIVRKNSKDIPNLTNAVAKFLVDYLHAVMGAIYVVNRHGDGITFLNLRACYAFDRKKFLKKQVKPGQGLVGQCFLEQEYIFMTDIPHDYFSIRSGLGDAPPNSLLIIPMKFNNEIECILELASLEIFSEQDRAFLEAAGEIVAAAINNMRNKERTSKLLEKAQKSAEDMQSQEEELRQNMEELEATHEEMDRKQREYESILIRHGINIQQELDEVSS